jgi:hypothetical protein
MTRRRTPTEWAITLGFVALVLWLQTPSAYNAWQGLKWRLSERERVARQEAEFLRMLAHVHYEAWEATHYPEENSDSL